MRECKQCGKMYVPDPFHYMPICPECAGTKRAGTRSKPSNNIAGYMQTAAAYAAKREMDRIQREQERAARRAEEDQRNAMHRRWLNEVWKRYPCKNPKCHNTITLYNRDQARYAGNKRLPEYCNDCRRDTPCKKCGYVAAKWMHDEHDGLCRRCYEEEQRAKRLEARQKIRQVNQSKPSVQSSKPPAQNSNSKDDGIGCWGCFIWAWIIVVVLGLLSTCTS